jgi:hypothetical protein
VRFDKVSTKDPRTVARDISGIFDSIFPQLTSGVVGYLNRKAIRIDSCSIVPDTLVQESDLSKAMLFEVAFVRGEQLISGITIADWDDCLTTAIERQRRYFDARLPEKLSEADKKVADWTASNLVKMLNYIKSFSDGGALVKSPQIPGYQWISSGVSDFSIGTNLIEVKCTNKRFSASDYRQIMMYWLLSYASLVEKGTPEWINGILINPRLNYILEVPFNNIIAVAGAGRSKIEILEIFSSMVGEDTLRMMI